MRRVAEHSEDNPATPGVRVTSISLMHPTGLNLNLIQHRSGDRESFSEFRVGLDHLSFAVESRDELERWVEHFQACGVGHSGISDQVYGSVDGEFRTSVLVFRDPDNIQLELFALV